MTIESFNKLFFLFVCFFLFGLSQVFESLVAFPTQMLRDEDDLMIFYGAGHPWKVLNQQVDFPCFYGYSQLSKFHVFSGIFHECFDI